MRDIIGEIVWVDRYYGESGKEHPAVVREKRAKDYIVEYLDQGKILGDPSKVGRFLEDIGFIPPAKFEGRIPQSVYDW